MKRFLILLSLFLFQSNYGQSESDSPNDLQNRNFINHTEESSLTFFEFKQEFLYRALNLAQNPAYPPTPSPKFRPTVFSLLSIAWGAFIIHDTQKKENGVYKQLITILGVGFIVYGFIGSIDWE